jgi:hypothetical protein
MPKHEGKGKGANRKTKRDQITPAVGSNTRTGKNKSNNSRSRAPNNQHG